MMDVLIAFYISFPALLLYLAYKFPLVNKIGPVIICYIVGITMGNSGVLPDHVLALQESASTITVGLALPLLLFSMDIRRWSRLAGKTITSLALAIVSIAVVSFAGYMVLRLYIPDAWKIVGMVVGVYTGGTPNLAALKTALGVNSTTFILLHTYDTLWSFVYMLFMMSVAQRLFLRFLPRFKPGNNGAEPVKSIENIEAYKGLVTKRNIPGLIWAFGASLFIGLVALGVKQVMPASFSQSAAILTITTLGIAGSFLPRLNRIPSTFQLGMYLILIFSLIVGSMVNIHSLVTLHLPLLFYVFVAIFGTTLLHAILCYFARVDADTFIITSVSAIMSPPFVPLVAGSLKNEEIILSGLTTGIIGYAIGNYLGVGLAYLVHAIGG